MTNIDTAQSSASESASTACPDGLGPIGLVPATFAAVLAGYHLLTPGAPGATYGSASDWTRELATLGYLAGSIAAVAAAVRGRLAPRAALVLVGCGYGLILLGVAIGLVLQDDPDWFFLLAGPGLLLSTAGFVTWTVSAIRRHRLPVWGALWCTAGGLTAIFGAEFGLSLVIAAFWVWLSLSSGRSARRADAPGPSRATGRTSAGRSA